MILYPLHPHPPYYLYISLLYLTYRHSIYDFPVVPHLRCHTCPPSSTPDLLFFHTHHTVYLPPLLSSPTCFSSAVLVTSFSIIPALFLNIFLPRSFFPLFSPCSTLIALIYFLSPSCSNFLTMIYYSCSTILCSNILTLPQQGIPDLYDVWQVCVVDMKGRRRLLQIEQWLPLRLEGQ